MANATISSLSAAAVLTGIEEVPIVQNFATVKTTTQDIANLASVGYTSYVAKISGSGTITPTVFSNTTGLSLTWVNGNATFAPAYFYSTTVNSAASTIAVFIAGKAVLDTGKGNTYRGINASYDITAVNPSQSTLDIWYDTAGGVAEGIPEVTVEIRIYP